jgi:hypothetical protein
MPTINDFSDGRRNTALGFRALSNSTGSRNLALGLNAGFNLTSRDSNISLGHTGFATESNTMRLGQVNSQTRTFMAGITGVPVSGSTVVINSNGQLGTVVSSARYKHDPQGQRQYGLIAEKVAKVYPELVTTGADGKVESVQYHELIPMLLNEVQHQRQEIVELQAQNERLQAALAQQNAAVAARLERLEAGAVRTAAATAGQEERSPAGAGKHRQPVH